QNVCEGVRVEELLRGVVAPGVTDPEGEVTAGTDPEPPLYVELECRRQEHGDDGEPRPGLPHRVSPSAAAPRLARSRNAPTALPFVHLFRSLSRAARVRAGRLSRRSVRGAQAAASRWRARGA